MLKSFKYPFDYFQNSLYAYYMLFQIKEADV